MKKVELLSPVGNMRTLPYAVFNGADAVYLSGKKFGARKYADNFDDDEIVKAIHYCHLYDVKIYVTVNTLIFDDEMKEVLEYIKFLYENGVDALILQDIGLIKRVHDLYPDLEIHISTQCHNHNDEGISFFEKLGAKRIVLDREMTLDEITKLKTKLEKEVFVHGALCVSYSGCCLFSSMNGNRSGNRGECVASCRLPYELYRDEQKVTTSGEYLLSTKELNTLSHLKELLDANIDCFKIEGRMKSPEYVGYVTKLYRTMIDKYYNAEEMILTDEELLNLKKLYNRDFTAGYLFNETGKKLMNINSPNHIGVPVGEVIKYDNKYIKIKLNADINQEDGVRFPNSKGMILNKIYNEKLMLVNSLKKGAIAIVDNKVNLKMKGTVLKTIDKKLLLELARIDEKKIPIDMEIICHKNRPIELIVSDNRNTIKKEYSKVEEAKTSPIKSDRIISQLQKVGNTPFKINSIKTNIDDNVFVSIKDINEIRRITLDDLIVIRQNSNKRHHVNTLKASEKIEVDNVKRINVLIRNEKQLKVCIAEKIDYVYTDDYSLYQKYKNDINIYYRLPRVMLKHPNYKNEKLLATEIGSVEAYAKNNDVIADYTLNVTNSDTINTLMIWGAKLVTISPEITENRLEKVGFCKANVEYLAYGTIELMIMKYCPIKMLDNNDAEKCNLCDRGHNYYLKNHNGFIYPIINTKHYTHIMHKEAINNIKNIKYCQRIGINNFRIELFNETEEEVKKIISEVKREMNE